MQEAPGALGTMARAIGRRSMGTRARRESVRGGTVYLSEGDVCSACVLRRCGDASGPSREWAGREGVNRIFLYELRHTRIPKYSTHKPQSARDSLQRRDRTHKFRTHAAALHAPRARNHHTQLS